MPAYTDITVVEHDLVPTTDIAAQLRDASIAERKVYPGSYYAASGRLSNGDVIEMYDVEERAAGSLRRIAPNGAIATAPRCIYLARNGVCNRRRYDLDGATADLADWLRGRHSGSREPVLTLGVAGARILDGLYADTE